MGSGNIRIRDGSGYDELANALSAIPATLHEPLLKEYYGILAASQAANWELAGVKAGKFCEICYCVAYGALTGSYPASPTKPANFVAACTQLEKLTGIGGRSLRIQIPRLLISLYELRNNRSIGHVGGDVDPNAMDAMLLLAGVKWAMGELVRVFHHTSVEVATSMVNVIAQRSTPAVWEINGRTRILRTDLSVRDKVLMLLYHAKSAVDRKRLVLDAEYAKASMFATRVLRPLHKEKLIEYDVSSDKAEILPPGIIYVEKSLIVNALL